MKFQCHTIKHLLRILVVAVASTVSANVFADAATELAKKTQNPVSDLISVPFENNANFRAGPDNKVLNVLNIKPVVPIKLTDNWNCCTRLGIHHRSKAKAHLISDHLPSNYKHCKNQL